MAVPTWQSRLAAVIAALPLDELGELYCDFGGATFWRQRVDEVERLGREWALQLSPRLRAGGTSLYVGAGVAELAAMLLECEIGRTVVASNRRDRECRLLECAIAAAGDGPAPRFVAGDATELAAQWRGAAYDHLSLVSVLTDPETWPVLSDLTYGRRHPAQIDPCAFAEEHAAARRAIDRMLRGLADPAVVTTTFEEVPWVIAGAADSGWSVDADDVMVETAVVGDAIGFLTLRRRPGTGPA